MLLITAMDLHRLDAFLAGEMAAGRLGTPLFATPPEAFLATFDRMRALIGRDVVQYGYLYDVVAAASHVTAEFMALLWTDDRAYMAATGHGRYIVDASRVRPFYELTLAYAAPTIVGPPESLAAAFRAGVLAAMTDAPLGTGWDPPLPAALDAVVAAARAAGVDAAGAVPNFGGSAERRRDDDMTSDESDANVLAARALIAAAERGDLNGMLIAWWAFGALGPDPYDAGTALLRAAEGGHEAVVAWLLTDTRRAKAALGGEPMPGLESGSGNAAIRAAMVGAAVRRLDNTAVMRALLATGALTRRAMRSALVAAVIGGGALANVRWLLDSCALEARYMARELASDRDDVFRPRQPSPRERFDEFDVRPNLPLLALNEPPLDDDETGELDARLCANLYGFENLYGKEYGKGRDEQLTLLSLAVAARHDDIARLLVARGADVRAVENQAARVAAAERNWTLFNWLLWDTGAYNNGEAKQLAYTLSYSVGAQLSPAAPASQAAPASVDSKSSQ